MNQKPLICDICSSHDVVVGFLADNFVMSNDDNITHESIGSWLVCRDCEELIDHRDMEGMLNRALDLFCIRYNIVDLSDDHRNAMKEQLRKVYQTLFGMSLKKITITEAMDLAEKC